ncbi:MAG TPA: SRPBCC family protein [Aldersonia sp.]
MPPPTVVAQSRTIPVSVEYAYDKTLPMPMPTLFRHWYGPLPPIKQIRDEPPSWDTVGQTRTIVLAGTGTLREQLTRVDPPHGYDYRITGITGPLAPLVGVIEGAWRFEPAGAVTKVTWQWTITPRTRAAQLAMPPFTFVWRGYARSALAELEKLLVA